MDAELYQEKMDQNHRHLLCRMLKEKNLPDDLLERYAQVKRLVDRIDGHLTPGNLAMIIISVGSNPEIATELLDESGDEVIEVAVGSPIEQVGKAASITKTSPEIEIGQVSGATGQAVQEPAPEKEQAKLWSPGMPVRVLTGDDIKPGRIVNVSDPSEVGAQVGAKVKIRVEFEGGDTETFDEDEVEAD